MLRSPPKKQHHRWIDVLPTVVVLCDGVSVVLAQTHTTTPAVIAKVVGVAASVLARKLCKAEG